MSRRAKTLTAYTIIFILIFTLCAMFPDTGDDWFRLGLGRSITSPLSLIRTVADKWLSNNARILGNVLAYSAAKSTLLRDISRSAILFLLVLFTARVSDADSAGGAAAVCALCLMLPKALFREVYPWAAGFYNYVPPVVLILIYLDILLRKKSMPAAALAVGFAGQLFIENAALYAVALDFMILAYCLFNRVKVPRVAVFHLVGAVLGAVLLFASPAYSGIFAGGGSYDVGGGGLTDTMDKNLTVILESTVIGCPVILAGAPVVLLARHRGSRKPALFVVIALIAVISGSFFLDIPYKRMLAALWAVLVFAATVIGAAGEERLRSVLYLLSAAVFAAPLLIVNPVGPRCLFGSYVFLILFLVETGKHAELPERASGAAAYIACAAVFCCWLWIYVPIHLADSVRVQMLRGALERGEREITVNRLPNGDCLWEPESKKIEYAYFYDSPGDLAVSFEPK